MKNLFTTFLFIGGLLVYIVLLGNRGGAPAGRTGAPEDATCASAGCHNTTVNSGSATINLGINDSATTYLPGATHKISISITDAQNIARNGFEIVALDAQNSNIGEWVLSGDETRERSFGGRRYITQTNAGSANSAWEIDWKAPDSDVGDITFYLAYNDANNNGSTSGDDIYTTSLGVSAEVVSSVNSINSIEAISLFPNPVQQVINLKIGLTESTNLSGQLVNLSGQIVGQLFNEQLSNGIHYLSINTPPNLASGLYLLELRNLNGGVKTVSILKQ